VQAIDKMRFWATQAREPVIWYEHKEYGYNYRLSNVCAAIGRGQLDAIDQKLGSRAKIHQRYVDGLKELPVKIKESKYPGANYWLSLLIIQDETIHPTQVVAALQNAQIESRPAWKPLHMQPIFKNATFFAHDDETPVSEKVFQRALCLPSGDGMTEEQQNEVIAEVIKAFRDGSTLEKRELRLPIYND
jgi:pyridoxal phosphate-dependent aminotransferase EpsN